MSHDFPVAVVVVVAVATYQAVGTAAVDLACFVLGDVLHVFLSLSVRLMDGLDEWADVWVLLVV